MITAVTVPLEELSEDEQRRREHLERQVEKAFYLAGLALQELRDKRLYRSSHKNFEEYCRDRFKYNRSYSYQLIDAAIVVDNLQKCPQFADIFPSKEGQVRPLTKLEPLQQRLVWQTAVLEAGNKVPSGRIVKGIVERLKEKPLSKASDFCQAGDVFTLTKLEASERKYNGCWAIAIQINDFTVVVAVHDQTLIVKPENLNKIDSPEAHHQLPILKERLKRLRDQGILDRSAYILLESLGRQMYLTPVEDGLLRWLEEYYGVDEKS